MSLVLKSPAEIAIMDRGCRIIREIHQALEGMIRHGMTTAEIDRFAEERIREAGARPAFKDYPHPSGGSPFPGTACTSINDEVVHGVPSEHVKLSEGDVVSVDVGVIYEGYYGDSCRTFPVGRISEPARRLIDVTRESLELAIEQARVGNRVSDIGHVVQKHVEVNGFSVVREFVGHGIGAQLHEDPQVPNFGVPGRRERLQAGMVLAIEPMVNAGGADVVLSADDGWTARTRDGSLSAHFEYCVAITESGPTVLGRPVA